MTARIVHHTVGGGLISVELRHMSVTGTAAELESFVRLVLAALVQKRDAEKLPLVPPIDYLNV